MKIGEHGYLSKILAPKVMDQILDHLIISRVETTPENLMDMVIELMEAIGCSAAENNNPFISDPDEQRDYILHCLTEKWFPDAIYEETETPKNVIKFPDIH